jgi:hypothetical protein
MKNYIKKNLEEIGLLIFMFVLPILSFANGDTTTSPNIVNPLVNSKTLNDLIKNILTGLIKIGMPIIVIAVIYCGFLFVAARGNSEKLSDAKRALLYTLIGAAILLGSWAIAQLITSTVQAL